MFFLFPHHLSDRHDLPAYHDLYEIYSGGIVNQIHLGDFAYDRHCSKVSPVGIKHLNIHRFLLSIVHFALHIDNTAGGVRINLEIETVHVVYAHRDDQMKCHNRVAARDRLESLGVVSCMTKSRVFCGITN